MRGSTAGLPDTFPTSAGTTYYTLITALDLLFSSVVVCPCVVGYWRSVWTLMDIYVLPSNHLLSSVVSLCIGICGHLFFLLFQNVLEKTFHPDKSRILFYLASRLYTIIFAFVCVNGWRGPWELLTIHSDKTDLKGLVVTTLVGLVALIAMRGLRNVSSPPCVIVNDAVKGYFEVLTMFRITNVLDKTFHPDKSRILFYLASRLYTIIFAFVCVNGWRGPWELLTIHSDKTDLNGLVVTTFVGLVALIAMRGLPNVSSPPYVIVNDAVKGYFEVLTMFRITVKEKTSLYIMDCLFSILVVGTLVVFVWRGSWIMVDLLLFPDNQELSVQGSLIIGYFIILVVFLMQPVVRSICCKLDGAARLIVADLFIIICLAGTINVWRGIWKSLDMYLLPDNLELSSWISLGVSLTLLILLGCSNSLLIRGVYIDAEEPDGRCVVLPCYYFRLIFQEEKLKKLNKKMYQIQQMEKSKEFEKNHVVTIGTISAIVEDNLIKQGFSDLNSNSDNGEKKAVYKENYIN